MPLVPISKDVRLGIISLIAITPLTPMPLPPIFKDVSLGIILLIAIAPASPMPLLLIFKDVRLGMVLLNNSSNLGSWLEAGEETSNSTRS